MPPVLSNNAGRQARRGLRIAPVPFPCFFPPYFYVNACPCGIRYFYGLRSFLFYARLGVLAFVVKDLLTAAVHRCKHLSEADIRWTLF